MMSASTSRSIGSTFSSISTTSCSRGVMPATVGSDRFGNTHFLLRLGRIRSNVQKDSGFLGAIRQIFIVAFARALQPRADFHPAAPPVSYYKEVCGNLRLDRGNHVGGVGDRKSIPGLKRAHRLRDLA